MSKCGARYINLNKMLRGTHKHEREKNFWGNDE